MRARIGPATTLDTTVLLYVQKAKHNIWGGVRHGLVSGWKALRSTNMPVNVKRVLVIRVNIRASITFPDILVFIFREKSFEFRAKR